MQVDYLVASKLLEPARWSQKLTKAARQRPPKAELVERAESTGQAKLAEFAKLAKPAEEM